ncbi:MAG: hypothetical protein HYT46_01825 [Candidatus Vogelbacteria bacterium]|nr:hypothetical protein [Candidatus Vogelbacteria bacterium]
MIPLIAKIKSEIVDPLISFLFVLGFLYFLYGVWELVRGSESEEARATGRQHILWGVVGMFIMISFWGIMNLICRTINC